MAATALITGGAGFIGAHLAHQLLARGYRVHCLDALHHYTYPIKPTFLENVTYRHTHLLRGAEVHRLSTATKDSMRRIIDRVQPDYIFHLAALPLANVAVRDPEEAFQSIVQGTTNVVEVLRDYSGLTRLIYISSSMIYGDFDRDPMPEDAPPKPKDIYGGMKLSGEILVQVYAQRYAIPYSIIRPSAVYGPSDNNGRVIQAFLEAALRGEALSVTNPDSTFLDFTYVTDLAEGIAAVATSPEAAGATVNITAGQAFSLRQVIDLLTERVPGLAVTEHHEAESFRPSRGTLDIARARRLAGFQPEVSLADGLDRYLAYMRSYNPSLLGALTDFPPGLSEGSP